MPLGSWPIYNELSSINTSDKPFNVVAPPIDPQLPEYPSNELDVELYLIIPFAPDGCWAVVPTGNIIASVLLICNEVLGLVVPIPTLPLSNNVITLLCVFQLVLRSMSNLDFELVPEFTLLQILNNAPAGFA